MKARTTILTIMTTALCFSVTAWTQSNVAQQAQTYFLQARQGDSRAAEKAVALLEEAVKAAPNDASLWHLLGRSYFMRLGTQAAAAPAQDEIAATLRRAMEAFDRALSIDPNLTDALSGHGMALTILGGVQREQSMLKKGLEEMNRAVQSNPKSTHARLARAFTTVNFPPPIRSTPAVIEDLKFLIQTASSTSRRALDSLHILLGDVYFESDQLEQARAEYEAAASPSSTAEAQARSRLAALRQGSVPAGEISSFRAALGSRCTMCHAQ